MAKIILKIKNKKGFVLLFAVTLTALILSITLGVTNIALREIKFGTNARDTNNAFFAADVGIECAEYYDRGDINRFPVGGSATSITCAENSIAVELSSQNLWTFVVPELGSATQSCAIVTVDKTLQDGYVHILSKGYNIGSPDCTSPNPNRVERFIEVKYLY